MLAQDMLPESWTELEYFLSDDLGLSTKQAM